MKKNKVGIPNKEQLKRELYREKQKLRRREVLFGTVEALTERWWFLSGNGI